MELFSQALTIMTLSMALVFLFLFVVIQCMNATAYLIRRYMPGKPEASEDGSDEAEARARLAAAIAVAVGDANESKR